MSNTKLIFEALRRIAVMKGIDITKERLQIYSELLSKYDQKKVMDAALSLVKEKYRFPDISDFMLILDPKLSEEDEANEVSGAIIQAMAEFGYCNECSAREYLGEMAWITVNRFGGWSSLCKTQQRDVGILRAQLRNIYKANIKSAKVLADSAIPYQKETKAIAHGELEKLNFGDAQ